MFPTSPEMSTDEDKGFKQYLNSDASSSDPSDWGSVAAASPPSPLGKCDPWCSPLVFQCDSAWCWVVTGLPWILPRCVGTPFGGPPITRHPNMIDLGGIYNHCAWIIILLIILCRDYVVLWWTWKNNPLNVTVMMVTRWEWGYRRKAPIQPWRMGTRNDKVMNGTLKISESQLVIWATCTSVWSSFYTIIAQSTVKQVMKIHSLMSPETLQILYQKILPFVF